MSGSLLDAMIARLSTQRAALERAVALVRDLPGPFLEVGLGKGRTCDHLRRLAPEREIFAFDRDVHAPAEVVPDAAHLLLGELGQTLPALTARLGRTAAFAHCDLGSRDAARDRATAALVSAGLPALMRPGAAVLSDRELSVAGWVRLSLAGAEAGFPYYLYRVG